MSEEGKEHQTVELHKGERGFEYLDHTADIQIHTWGPDVKTAFEEAALGMFGYMTDIESVQIDPKKEPHCASVKGEDIYSLLYQFLEELLFIFSTEFYIFRKVTITDFNEKDFSISFKAEGETWDLSKHSQGQEIKAITYSAMKINPPTKTQPAELWVILDI